MSPFTFISNIINQFSIATCRFAPGWQEKSLREITLVNRNRAVKWSRILLVSHLAIAILCLATLQFELLLVISMTPMYGGWLFYLINNTQHAGLIDNTNDFRKSCRTILLNPFFILSILENELPHWTPYVSWCSVLLPSKITCRNSSIFTSCL